MKVNTDTIKTDPIHTGNIHDEGRPSQPIVQKAPDTYITPKMTGLEPGQTYYDGYKNLYHPPELTAAVNTQEGKDIVYFNPSVTNKKMASSNYTYDSKLEVSGDHIAPVEGNTAKITPTKPIENKTVNTTSTLNAATENTTNNIEKNKISVQSNPQDYCECKMQPTCTCNKSIVSSLEKNDGVTKVTLVKPIDSQLTRVNNPDGSTSFNWNHTATTWNYNYVDLTLKNAQQTAGQTKIGPLVMNGQVVNGRNPVNTLQTDAITQSNNVNNNSASITNTTTNINSNASVSTNANASVSTNANASVSTNANASVSTNANASQPTESIQTQSTGLKETQSSQESSAESASNEQVRVVREKVIVRGNERVTETTSTSDQSSQNQQKLIQDSIQQKTPSPDNTNKTKSVYNYEYHDQNKQHTAIVQNSKGEYYKPDLKKGAIGSNLFGGISSGWGANGFGMSNSYSEKHENKDDYSIENAYNLKYAKVETKCSSLNSDKSCDCANTKIESECRNTENCFWGIDPYNLECKK